VNAWPFVIAAWALTVGASAVLAGLSYAGMRRAEAAAEALRRR